MFTHTLWNFCNYMLTNYLLTHSPKISTNHHIRHLITSLNHLLNIRLTLFDTHLFHSFLNKRRWRHTYFLSFRSVKRRVWRLFMVVLIVIKGVDKGVICFESCRGFWFCEASFSVHSITMVTYQSMFRFHFVLISC